MSKLNFDEFPAYSEQIWKQLATKELRGKPLESINFHEGALVLKPVSFDAGQSLKLRKPSKGQGNSWLIRQNVLQSDSVEIIKSVLSGGVDVVSFNPFKLQDESWDLLEEHSGVQLVLSTNQPIEGEKLVHEKLGAEGVERIVAFDFDPWAFADSDQQRFSFELPALNIPNYSIDTSALRDRGCSVEDELVFGLSAAHHCLVRLLDHGLTIDDASVLIHFKTGIGAHCLTEIAKLRVLRNLWARIVEEYEPEHSCSINTRVTARATRWNLGDQDYNTNLIRLTNCALAAVVGGVDEILAETHDGMSSEKSLRLSRNIQLLLRHESWMSHVNDPAAGSYFIENLSSKLADYVWQRFVEEESGFDEDYHSGLVQEKITASAMMDSEAINGEGTTMIGMNKFQNPYPEAELGKWLNAGNAVEKEVES